MQLIPTINEKWKLCTIASIFCCLILLYYLNQNDKTPTFSSSKNTILQYYSTNSSLLLVNFSPPPVKTSIVFIKEIPETSNITSNLTVKQPEFAVSDQVTTKNNVEVSKSEKVAKENSEKECDMFDGKWVYKKEEKPKYDSINCPIIENKMNCRKNGRPDLEYEKWRWEAKHCDIPLFNGRGMLRRLRNKRVIIVGDSLNRNMWESLVCLLYTSVHPSRVEVRSKNLEYKVLKAKDYNTRIEFHWSPFLVEFDTSHKSGRKVLVLDKLSPNSKLWRGADIMVFNSGHWWTHRGKFKKWDILQYKGQLIEKMPIQHAYDIGMKTWAKWIQNNVDPKKTKVFFRSISTNHNVGDQWCYNSTQPIMDESYDNPFPKIMVNVIESLIKEMSTSHVKYLNITKLSQYRYDAHPSVYRSSKWKDVITKYKRTLPSFADCSHWCLPGLPDTWNRLLYASLFYF